MNPTSHEQNKQHAFDAFCKKVLRNDVRNYYDEMKRLRDREVSFSELPAQELGRLSATDRHFETEQAFNVLGRDIIVNDESIAEALRNLTKGKRDIIMLYYFRELSDVEIGSKLNLKRSTIQYQRAGALRELKDIMEGDANEQKSRKK